MNQKQQKNTKNKYNTKIEQSSRKQLYNFHKKTSKITKKLNNKKITVQKRGENQVQHKKVLTTVLTLVVITSIFSLTFSYVKGSRPPTINKEFTLTAQGTAYIKGQGEVDVELVLEGMAKTRGKIWKIYIKDGEITADDQSVMVYKGKGTLVTKHGYISLHIYTKSQYGYRRTILNMKGKINCDLEVTLKDRRAILPTENGYLKLKNVQLAGQVTTD